MLAGFRYSRCCFITDSEFTDFCTCATVKGGFSINHVFKAGLSLNVAAVAWMNEDSSWLG